MTYDQALSEAQKMQAEFRKVDVPCSIELVPGRGSDPWGIPRKYLRMHHHTASYYVPGGNMTPLLYLVKVGRSDVVGPLCNGYGGFDRVYRIICMGEANHPGAGGPITIDGVYVPKDSARGPTWGTEFEGGYQDWENIPGMLEFMGRCDVALANYGVHGTPRPLTSQMEHKTWAPTRKVDRRNFTRASGIALTEHWANQLKKKDKDKMYAFVKGPSEATIWLTDLMTKRGMRSMEEYHGFLYVLAASGATLFKGGQVDIWDQGFIDNIATVDADLVADINGAHQLLSGGTGDRIGDLWTREGQILEAVTDTTPS